MLLRFRVSARSLSASCQAVTSSYHRYASNTPPEDDSKGNTEAKEPSPSPNPSPKGTIDAPIGRERNRGRNPVGGRGRAFASQNTPRDQQKTPFFPSFIQDITNNTQASSSAQNTRKPPTKKWEPAQPDQQQLQQQRAARQADEQEQANRLFAALEASEPKTNNQQGPGADLQFLDKLILQQQTENLDQKLSSDSSTTIKMASGASDLTFDEFMQGAENAEAELADLRQKRAEFLIKMKDTDPEDKDFLAIFRGTQTGIRHFLRLNPGQQTREDRIRNNPFLTRPSFQYLDVLRKIPVKISEDRLQWLRQGEDNDYEREPGPDGKPRLHKYAVVTKEDGSLEFGDPELQELYDQTVRPPAPAPADGAEAPPEESSPEELKLIEKFNTAMENIILDLGDHVNAVFARAQPLGYVDSGKDLTEDSIWLKSMELEVVRRRARRDRLKKIHQTRRERSQPDGYRKPPKPLRTIESRILSNQETRGAYSAQDLLHDATALNKKSPSPAGVRLAKETFSADEQKLIDDVVQRHALGIWSNPSWLTKDRVRWVRTVQDLAARSVVYARQVAVDDAYIQKEFSPKRVDLLGGSGTTTGKVEENPDEFFDAA